MTMAAHTARMRLFHGRGGDIPSIDYYLLGALRDLVRSPEGAGGDRPIVRRGPYVFSTRDCLVIVRYITARELQWIGGESRFERIYYVLDDMLPLAEQCEDLPFDYRARLASFARDGLLRILDLQPTIVAPSQAILDLFPRHCTELIDPCWLTVAEDFRHFRASGAARGPIKLAFLGTRSHGAGLDFLTPVLERLLRGRDDMRCTIFWGKHAPPALERRAGIDNRAPLSWTAFKRFLARERFHVVLAPLPDTPFNRGRSLTKLMDAAAVGAAGVFSERAPFNRSIVPEATGLLLPDDAGVWSSEIGRLAADLSRARTIAEGGAACVRRIGNPARLRQFWSDRLTLATT